MQLHPLDISIIIGYLVLVVIAGVIISKKASKNLDSYFLGGKNLPWYILGASNASSMVDITGTMWMVYLMFAYGLKSSWIPWLWPHFLPVFMMVYLGLWLRRSNVRTGAEWIFTRFGNNLGGKLSHLSVTIFAIVSTIGFLSYAFKGIGKFAVVFFPWDLSPDVYAAIIMGVTTFYVILGGMYSVVITDIIQYLILTAAAICIAGIAMSRTSAESIAAVTPDGWSDLFFGWKLNLDWTGLMDVLNDKIAHEGYSLFGILFMMMLFKGVLASIAGPCPNYDMQRILATKTPREAALMSWFTSVTQFFPRYLMITGITVLGLVYFSPELKAMGSDVDFEQILPFVISKFIPVGLIGLVLAGLLAAFMSSFDSTVNAGAAYVANDIYKQYINPNASDKKNVYVSYLSSILLVAVGIFFGFFTESINSALQWIVAGLGAGYLAPNVLKWYWWRLNGKGYFAGMISGIGAALLFPQMFPLLSPLNAFPFILVISLAFSIIVSLKTKAESDETLKTFYKQVRPWGLWGPVLKKVLADDPGFVKNNELVTNIVNVIVGLIWQTSLVVIPIYLVIKHYRQLAISLAVMVVTSMFLKFYWYDKLPKDEK